LLDSLLQEIIHTHLLKMTTSFHPTQSVPSVIFRLDQLLPSLACGPYSDTTLAQLAALCKDMKAVGPLLDIEHKDRMDITQTLLTRIVQDTHLDLQLRLEVLEFIELRTLDWRTSEAVDNYYQVRFAQFDENKRNEQEKKYTKAAKSKEGENKRKLSFPSLSSIQEPYEDQQFVTVNGEKIFLDSSNPELAATARKMLVDHFSNRLPVPYTSNIKYSRTDLLILATSPLARQAPQNWDSVLENIPAVVQRPPVSNSMAASGDSNPRLTDNMPASLPLIRTFAR